MYEADEKKHYLCVKKGSLVGRYMLQDNTKPAWHSDKRSTPERVQDAVDQMIERLQLDGLNKEWWCRCGMISIYFSTYFTTFVLNQASSSMGQYISQWFEAMKSECIQLYLKEGSWKASKLRDSFSSQLHIVPSYFWVGWIRSIKKPAIIKGEQFISIRGPTTRTLSNISIKMARGITNCSLFSNKLYIISFHPGN